MNLEVIFGSIGSLNRAHAIEMIIGYSSWCSGSLPPQIFLCDPVGVLVLVPLIEASQSAHIEILSLFFSFSCSLYFFLFRF